MLLSSSAASAERIRQISAEEITLNHRYLKWPFSHLPLARKTSLQLILLLANSTHKLGLHDDKHFMHFNRRTFNLMKTIEAI